MSKMTDRLLLSLRYEIARLESALSKRQQKQAKPKATRGPLAVPGTDAKVST